MMLVRPYVHIVRNQDARTYNFSDLVEKFSKPAPAQQTKSTPRFSLNNIFPVSILVCCGFAKMDEVPILEKKLKLIPDGGHLGSRLPFHFPAL